MSYMNKIIHPIEPSMSRYYPERNIEEVEIPQIEEKVELPKLTSLSTERCSFQTKRGYLILTLVILLIVSILVVLFLITQISNSRYFGTMNYPTWAPGALTMTLIGLFTFLFGTLGFIFLNNSIIRRYIPYILGLMIAEVLSLVLFLFFLYSTGTALIAVFVMALVLLVEVYLIVFLGLKKSAATWFQLPYLLFLILLLIITIFIASTNKV